MAESWFCKVNGDERGPLPAAELKRMAARGDLDAQSLIRRGREGRWVLASRVKGLFSSVNGNHSAPQDSTPRDSAPPESRPQASTPQDSAPQDSTPRDSVPQAAGKPSAAAQPPAAVRKRPGPPPLPSAPARRAATAAKSEASSVPPATAAPGTSAVPTPPPAPRRAPPAPVPMVPVEASASGANHFLQRRKRNRISTPALVVATGAFLVVLTMVGAVALVIESRKSAGTGEASDASSPPASAADLDSLIRSVRQWTDASKARLQFDDLQIRVDAVWSERAEDGGPELGGERLFVEIDVKNGARSRTADFSSWSGGGAAGDAAAAVLIDGQGNVFQLDESRRDRDREAVPTTILPGESVRDLLVFRIAAAGEDDWRLLLPQAAIGRSEAFGFRIPNALVVAGFRPAGQFVQNGTRQDSQPSGNNVPQPAGDIAARPTVTQEPPEPAKQPSTFEDLIRAIDRVGTKKDQ